MNPVNESEFALIKMDWGFSVPSRFSFCSRGRLQTRVSDVAKKGCGWPRKCRVGRAVARFDLVSGEISPFETAIDNKAGLKRTCRWCAGIRRPDVIDEVAAAKSCAATIVIDARLGRFEGSLELF